MSEATEDTAGESEVKGVTEDHILGDLRSRYASVLCPVHGVPPQFEVDEAGASIEAFCCEMLGQMFRELRTREDAAQRAE